MCVLSRQIKKYRLEKNLTQDKLAKMVGVTTQAVSKWECGSTPDVHILPKIADVLDVTTDMLFGREEKDEIYSLARKMSRMQNEETYKFVLDICYAIEVGLIPDKTGFDDFWGRFINQTGLITDKYDYFSKTMKDSGMSTLRLSPDFQYCFFMKEPEKGLRDSLADPETLRKIFMIFSDKKLLNIIFYMYSRLNTPVSLCLIAKEVCLDIEETQHCMEILCENNLASCTVAATIDGDMNTYMYNQESSVIPLLCFADEISKHKFKDLWVIFQRTKPLL